MKSMIMLFVEVAAVVAVAACVKKPAAVRSPEAVTFVATNDCAVSREAWRKMSPGERKAVMWQAKAKAAVAGATERDKRDAVSCGVSIENWCTMSKKARKEARQKLQAAKLGLTVEQLKVERNRKAAEKAGCPLEKWNTMSVKERIEFRRQAKKG